ncbi:DUF3267 domain-containing protein [Ectobacillus ponti]|uniref:DUF3267 domain-containing protein n=1 Tax=Ectobacillus ponti TaxID=2961894 RepID=A0AA41XC11_9BACI|nr:DUF3267 domain-containing protein [Ectobacillus ponti]MCP8970118.1 DUF3267 domain-containing protein [Ectobacillus ponti]
MIAIPIGLNLFISMLLIWITLAPFLILSILAPLLLGAFGMLSAALKVLILLNAMASSVDLLTALLVLRQVPSGGVLRSNGPSTYWKARQAVEL